MSGLAGQRQPAAALDCKALLDLADLLVPALDLGRRFALAWDEAKEREGLIDFDDQIRRAAALLARQGAGRLDPLQARPPVRPYPDRRGAGHQRRAVVDHRRADRGFLRRRGPARRQAAHDLRGRRLQAGDLPLPGHQPGEFRGRAARVTQRIMADAGAQTIPARACRTCGTRARPLVPHRAAGARFRRHARSRRSATTAFGLADAARAASSATSGPGLVACGSRSAARRRRRRGRRRRRPRREARDTWLPGPDREMADRIAAQVKAWLTSERLPAGQGQASATPGRATSWCWCASGASWPG